MELLTVHPFPPNPTLMNNYQTLHPVKNKNHQKLITIKRKIEGKKLNKIHLTIKIHINWTTTGKDQSRNSAPNVEQPTTLSCPFLFFMIFNFNSTNTFLFFSFF
jgi:hypothetical protein